MPPMMYGEHMTSNSLYQYNDIFTKAQTVNHIADYEVPVNFSYSSLVNNISSTKIIPLVSCTYYGILLLCNLIIISDHLDFVSI